MTRALVVYCHPDDHSFVRAVKDRVRTALEAQGADVRVEDLYADRFDPTFTADGKAVWVPVKSTNEVVIIDTATWKEVARIKDAAFKQPHQIVFSSDGTTAFITTNNKMDHMADPAGHNMPGVTGGPASLVIVDVKTQKVVKALELGMNLTGMGARGSR